MKTNGELYSNILRAGWQYQEQCDSPSPEEQSWFDWPLIEDVSGQDASEKSEMQVQGFREHTRVNFQWVILAPPLQMRPSCAPPLNAELIEKKLSPQNTFKNKYVRNVWGKVVILCLLFIRNGFLISTVSSRKSRPVPKTNCLPFAGLCQVYRKYYTMQNSGAGLGVLTATTFPALGIKWKIPPFSQEPKVLFCVWESMTERTSWVVVFFVKTHSKLNLL